MIIGRPSAELAGALPSRDTALMTELSSPIAGRTGAHFSESDARLTTIFLSGMPGNIMFDALF